MSKIKSQKSKVIVLLICLFIGLVDPVSAQSPTAKPTTPKVPTPTSKPIDQKIGELKERIASRVAELNLVERRGYVGTIATKSAVKITLTDIQNRTKIIETDELTNIDGKELSSLTSGDTISVYGLYNKNSRVLLARFIQTHQMMHKLWGEVTDLDKTKFMITLKEPATSSATLVSFETATQAQVYGTDGKLTKAGFSRVEVGQKLFIAGTKETSGREEENRYTALRVIIFPTTPTSSPTLKPTVTKTATPTPR